MTRLWPSSLVAAAAACCLLGQAVYGHADHQGKGDGLAYQEIQGIDQFASNLTAIDSNFPDGWFDAKMCSHLYCVFANRQIAGGRGLAMVSTMDGINKVRAITDLLLKPNVNGLADPSKPPPFYEYAVAGEGIRLVANQTIKRGDHLMTMTPVLLVHHEFFKDVPSEEQSQMLASAVQLLPEATRKKFIAQVETANAAKTNNIGQFVGRYSFETIIGYAYSGGPAAAQKHYASYPEIIAMKHHCRPNLAYYLDGSHRHHTTAVRKISPGEEITLSYVNPFLSRKERSESLTNFRSFPCSCSHCVAGGDLMGLSKHDARHDEREAIEKLLKDPSSKGVTTDKIARLVEIYKEDGLHSRLSDGYELAAYNYNNLGYAKRAVKYANLAAQAGMVERGVDANDVIAMRIMAKDPEGHYSWRTRVKKDTPKAGSPANA